MYVESLINTKNQVCDFHIEVVRLGGAYIYEFNVHVCKQLYAYLIAMLCIRVPTFFLPHINQVLIKKHYKFARAGIMYTQSYYT